MKFSVFKLSAEKPEVEESPTDDDSVEPSKSLITAPSLNSLRQLEIAVCRAASIIWLNHVNVCTSKAVNV